MKLDIPEELKQPLKFGDQRQILALRGLEAKVEYEQLPDCKECDGDGEGEGDCDECGSTVMRQCEACEGEGKDAKALEAYWSKH